MLILGKIEGSKDYLITLGCCLVHVKIIISCTGGIFTLVITPMWKLSFGSQ